MPILFNVSVSDPDDYEATAAVHLATS